MLRLKLLSQGAIGGPAEFWYSIVNAKFGSTVPGSELLDPLDHIRPSGQPHKIFFWLFGQKHSHQSRSGGHFIELGNAHSDPLCTKERISVLLRGKGISTALSSFPRLTACLLKSPSCFWDCAGAQIVFTYFLKSTKSHPYYCVNVFCHRVSHHARRMNNEMKWNSIFKN